MNERFHFWACFLSFYNAPFLCFLGVDLLGTWQGRLNKNKKRKLRNKRTELSSCVLRL